MDYDPDIGGANMRSIHLDDLSDEMRKAILNRLSDPDDDSPLTTEQQARASAMFHAVKFLENIPANTSDVLWVANWIIYGRKPTLQDRWPSWLT